MITNKTVSAIRKPPSDDDIIEAILLLHSFVKPVATIARSLTIDEATVRHVIEHGTLPKFQQTFAWEDAV